MAKTIKFEFEGRDYCLEYTRKSVENMERQGFKPGELVEKPMLTLPTMFAGAFLANHKFTKRELIDRCFAKFTNKQELLSVLIDMYNEPINSLFDEPEEDSGNVKWEISES